MEEPKINYVAPDIITLPPSGDVEDVPTEFVAVIVAVTKAVFGKLKGAADMTDFGIVHCLAATIAASEPLQLVSSVVNELSLFLNVIV